MSFVEVSDFLSKIAKELDDKMPDIIATASMAEMMAMHKERIFDLGKKTDGSNIGNYSTTPAYFDKSAFIRESAFKPIGKPNKEGKSKKTKRTMYLAKGYSEFRNIQGREVERVNTKFSGSLESALRIYKFGEEVIYGNNDEKESKKIEGLQKKYGDIYELSQEERDFIINDIPEQAAIVVNKL